MEITFWGLSGFVVTSSLREVPGAPLRSGKYWVLPPPRRNMEGYACIYYSDNLTVGAAPKVSTPLGW